MTISPRKRRWFCRAALLLAVLGGGSYLFLNGFARWVIIHQIHQLSGLDAEIESVRITPTVAVVRGIRLRNAALDHPPLLTIAEVRADLTLIDGLTRGRFADAITIVRPSVQLEFSKTGGLLTALPKLASGSGKTTIPFRRLNVRDAEIHVAQHGGRRFDLQAIQLAVRCGESLELAAAAPKLFGGNWTFEGEFDPNTFAGSATLITESVQLRADDIRRLPLIPNDLQIPKRAGVTGAISVSVELPANVVDLRDCATDLRMELHSLNVPSVGIQKGGGTTRVTHRHGRINVGADGSILGGRVRVDADLDVSTETASGQLKWKAQGINLDSLCRSLELPASGILNLSGSAVTALSRNQIRFNAETQSSVSRVVLNGIPVDPVYSRASVNGVFTTIDGAVELSGGEFEVAAQSRGCHLEQVLPQLVKLASADRQTPTDADIDALLKRLQPQGRVSFVAAAKAPLTTALLSPEKITATVEISCEGVSTSEFRVEDNIAAIRVGAGRADVTLNDAKVIHRDSGRTATIDFTAAAPLHSEGTASAEFQMSQFPLAFPASLLGLRPAELDGDVSVTAAVTVPMHRLTDETAYSGQGHILAPHVVAGKQIISNAQLYWKLNHGVLSVPQLGAQAAAIAIRGDAHLNLSSPFHFTSNCSISAAELNTLSHAVGRLTKTDLRIVGAAAINCAAAGDLASKRFTLGGNALLQNFAIRNGQPATLNLNFKLNPDLLTVESTRHRFFGGDMIMNASLNGRGQLTSIAGNAHNVQVSPLQQMLGMRSHSDGAVSGQFSFADPLRPDRISGSATLASPQIKIAELVVQGLESSVVAESGAVRASLRATVAGAQCDATLRTAVPSLLSLNAASFNEPDQLPVACEAHLSQLSIARLRSPLQHVAGITLPKELTGIIQGSVSRTSETMRAGQIATGELSLSTVGWDRTVVSKQLLVRLRLRPGLLDVHNISGTVAEGRLTGRAALNLTDQPNGSFRIAVSGINLAKAAIPLGKAARSIHGRANLRIDGRIARRMTGRASLTTTGLRAFGVSASHIRIPCQWTIVPAQKMVHVHTNSASVDLGGGRVNGKVDARWDGRLDLNLTAQAQQIDTRRMLANKGRMPVGGVVSGSIRLRGDNARSIEDLSGQCDAEIKDVRTIQLSALQNLSKFVGTVGRSTSFQDGVVRGRLANGTVTVDRMALTASNVRIISDGTSTLSGRLNLNVSAYTGETGPADQLLKFAQSPLMLAVPAPISVIAQANEAIRNRTVHLQVTGSAQKPLIRVQPGRQLGQEAMQLLVKSALSSVPGGNYIQSAMRENTVR